MEHDMQSSRCECGCWALTNAFGRATMQSSRVFLSEALAGDRQSIPRLEELGWCKFLAKKQTIVDSPPATVVRKRRKRAVKHPDDPAESTGGALALIQESPENGFQTKNSLAAICT